MEVYKLLRGVKAGLYKLLRGVKAGLYKLCKSLGRSEVVNIAMNTD